MGEFVGSLVKVFQDYIYRDILYVLAGAAVLLAFLYAFDRLRVQDVPTVFALILVGFCYIVGYVVQETASLTGVVSTSYARPGKVLTWVLTRYSGDVYGDMPKRESIDPVWRQIAACSRKLPADEKAVIDRTSNLMQVGTAVGPACFLASLLVFLRGLRSRASFRKTFFSFDSALAMSLLTLSLLLITHGRMKAVQKSDLMLRTCTTVWCQADLATDRRCPRKMPS